MVAVLAVASLGSLWSTPARRAYCSFYEFVWYYQTLREPQAKAGFWERLTLSIALASSTESSPKQTTEQPGARPAAM